VLVRFAFHRYLREHPEIDVAELAADPDTVRDDSR
jgi:hypothetical protein